MRLKLIYCIALFVVRPVYSASIYVPGDQPTIQAGINAAAGGDSVIVAPGTYSEALQLRDGIVLKSSSGPEFTVITYNVGVYALITANEVGPTTEVTGFTLEGDNAIEKGLITDASSIEFSKNVVQNFWGIGLHFDGASRVQDCIVYHCGRAGIYSGAPTGFPTIEDCLLYDCGYAPFIASEAIGGHYGGGFVARRCTIVSNYDGIYLGEQHSYVEDCIVSANVRYGVYALPGLVGTVTCSDVWNNGTNYSGIAPGLGCISEDPRFCDPANLLYTLDVSSPCLPENNVCGNSMGAFGQGCGSAFTSMSFPAPADSGSSTGSAFIDLDVDGDLDLHVLRDSLEPDVLYRNDGSAGFAAAPFGPLADPGRGEGIDWGDFDNDGLLDVYVVNSTTANRLYRNLGDGNFADFMSPPLDYGSFDQGACWIDVDRDGLLDVYLTTHFAANRLYRNVGGGAFVEATPPALAVTLNCGSSAWGDYDSDGDSDVFIAVQNGADVLARNDGAGSFSNITAAPMNDADLTQGAAWGDFDNDADLDLYVCNFGAPNRLYRNDGGAFVDVTTGELGDAGNGQSGTWADFDNDRDLDLVLTNFGQPNSLFRNDGAGAFERLAIDAPPHSANSVGASWGDCDADGDLDLFIARFGSPDRLYRNDSPVGNHWIQITLEGTASNRSAIGARITAIDLPSGATQVREHGSNHGFWSCNQPAEHFGLGELDRVDVLSVRWPSGAIDFFYDVPADLRLHIVEGGGIVGAPTATASSGRAFSRPNPFRQTTEIVWAPSRNGKARLTIFDVGGRLVRDLAGDVPGAILWDGRNSSGKAVPQGIYFYRIESTGESQAGKLVRLR